MDDLVLQYRRVGQYSTGFILRRTDKGESRIFSFENLDFAPMMSRFAELVGYLKKARPIIERTDRKNTPPLVMVLDEATVELLRVDPQAAIRSMTVDRHEPSPVVPSAALAPTSAKPLLPILQAGYDALADAFGEMVFIRVDDRTRRGECPFCGRWGAITDDLLTCLWQSCHIVHVPTKLHNARWASVLVEDLLVLGGHRFYLPRKWNNKAWITYAELETKYKQFIKERDACLEATDPQA
jgi:hypothetical protein